MEKSHSKSIALLAALVLVLASAINVAAQAAEAGPPCGLWVNTAYNQSPEPAVLLWTEEGMLTSWDESFDSRCAGSCRCVVPIAGLMAATPTSASLWSGHTSREWRCAPRTICTE
jgi:hypothetical protein